MFLLEVHYWLTIMFKIGKIEPNWLLFKDIESDSENNFDFGIEFELGFFDLDSDLPTLDSESESPINRSSLRPWLKSQKKRKRIETGLVTKRLF